VPQQRCSAFTDNDSEPAQCILDIIHYISVTLVMPSIPLLLRFPSGSFSKGFYSPVFNENLFVSHILSAGSVYGNLLLYMTSFIVRTVLNNMCVQHKYECVLNNFLQLRHCVFQNQRNKNIFIPLWYSVLSCVINMSFTDLPHLKTWNCVCMFILIKLNFSSKKERSR
jgi:hypothetical protein